MHCAEHSAATQSALFCARAVDVIAHGAQTSSRIRAATA
jgi:hypothetical protein